ncbi:MAG: prolyl oligopeptidase family serine peptidase, partial [Thermoanaerobaculia bacterium]
PAVVARMEEEGVLYDQDFQAPWDINTPVIDQKLALRESPSETWLHDLATRESRPATPQEAERESLWVRGWDDLNTAEAAWSPDHTRLAYNKYIDDPAKCPNSCYPLFVRNSDGSGERLLTPGVYYAGNPQWSADGKRIFFERRDGDGRGATLVEVSPEGGTPRVLLRPQDHLSECSWDARKEHAACLVESHASPARVAFVDIARGTLRVVADVNPEFANLRFSPAARIDWKNEQNMFAYLVEPLDRAPGRRYPLIVTTYRSGTGFLRGGVGNEYPIHVFAARGFAVLAFDSGADKNIRPGDFQAAMEMWEAPLDGLRTAIRMAGERGVADVAKVGFTGLSHGSEIGAHAISRTDLFRAVSMSGAGTWEPGMVDMAPAWLRQYLARWGLIDADGRPIRDRFDRLSATANVEKIHTPLLLNVPDNEYLTSLPLYSAMRAWKKPVEMWVYANEYHQKIQPKHRYSVYERNLDWFRFWLKGEEDSNPAKKEQYERWRKLRELDEADRKAGSAAVKP